MRPARRDSLIARSPAAQRCEILGEVLAVVFLGDRHLGGELPVCRGLGLLAGRPVRTGDRLVGVRKIPVADPIRLAHVEAPTRVPERRLGEAEGGVHARDLPLATGEVLRRAFRSLAPVEARRVGGVQHALVVLTRLDQAPDLVEEVDPELPVVRRQAVRASTGVHDERPRFSRYCWW